MLPLLCWWHTAIHSTLTLKLSCLCQSHCHIHSYLMFDYMPLFPITNWPYTHGLHKHSYISAAQCNLLSRKSFFVYSGFELKLRSRPAFGQGLISEVLNGLGCMINSHINMAIYFNNPVHNFQAHDRTAWAHLSSTTVIPEVYHWFLEVFSNVKVSSLPPHRPYDWATDILLATMFPCNFTSLNKYVYKALQQPSTSSNLSIFSRLLFCEKRRGTAVIIVGWTK